MPAGKLGLATVLVVQEIFGVHEHIRDVTRRLAKQGYLAVAPELYTRQGDATKYTDIGALINDIVSKVPDAQVMADLDAAAAWAVQRTAAATTSASPDSAGADASFICTPLTIRISRRPSRGTGRLRAAYCPGDQTPLDVAAQIKAPVLGLYGGADGGIPNDTVEQMGRCAEGGRQHSVGDGDLSRHAARLFR